MNPTDAVRDRYAEGSLETASASKIVTMCFDRLDRELSSALRAIDERDHYECNAALAHAQDLVTELAGMLDLDVWEHSGSLVALYDYLLRLLTAANTFKSAPAVAEAQRIVRELGGAFRTAAEEAAVGATAPESSAPADPPRLSIQA